MADKSTSDILDFGGSDSSTSNAPRSSHLAELQPRSNYDNKRKKPNIKQVNKSYLVAQKEKVKLIVHQVIDIVLVESELEFSFDVYYKSVESLCRFKHIEQSILADHLKSKLEDHFYNNVNPSISDLLKNRRIPLKETVELYLEIFEKWQNKLRLLSKLFLYLDRCYLMQHPSKKMILELGLMLFVDNLLIDNGSNEDNLAEITLQKHKLLLSKVREFEDTKDLELAKQFSSMLVRMNFNNQIKLHVDLLNLIISNYNLLKDSWFKKPETYMHIILTKISREITFFKDCGYNKDFLAELLQKLKWALIFQNFNTLMKNCLPFLIRKKHSKQLELLYGYCMNSMEEFQFNSISIFVFEWGQLVSDSIYDLFDKYNSSLKNIIPSLVELNTRYKDIALDNFQKNELFEFEVRKSFNKTFNVKKINTFVIVQLCKYCDSFFKNANKKTTKEDGTNLSFTDFQLRVLVIFKSLNNKTDFILQYKKDLSKRLILGKSPNYILERRLVESFLKLVGEGDETVGLQVMFKDLEISKEKYSLVSLGDNSVDFTALILEQKHWPEIPKGDCDIILPPQLSSILDNFTAVYHNSEERLKDHTLDWSHYRLHQLTIIANFDLGLKELDVNLLQAVIILLFNERDRYAFDELMALTNMSEKLLKMILVSLSSDRYKILIQDGFTFTYNSLFSDKSQKIRIPLSKEKDGLPGTFENDVSKTIQRNRDIEFRSALIRVTKNAKQIIYPELVNQAMLMVEKNGPCTIGDLKTNLEYLVENEYVKREVDGKTFSYIP